jgi:hypothetical protein
VNKKPKVEHTPSQANLDPVEVLRVVLEALEQGHRLPKPQRRDDRKARVHAQQLKHLLVVHTVDHANVVFQARMNPANPAVNIVAHTALFRVHTKNR